MTTHMIIGDTHAKPEVSNERFTWLGKLVVDLKPDKVMDMGDWADLPSLSSYDKGRKSFEGRRFIKDVEAARDARKKFIKPLKEYNRKRATDHKSRYHPELHAFTGNHENRIIRATELSPELDGTITIEQLGAEEFGWKRHKYLDIVEIDGVHYSHYFPSGILGFAIGGEYPAANALKKHFVSCTAGHSHIRDFAERTRADGQKILGLIAGCCFEHYEAWAGSSNMKYWRGVIICHNVENGYYDPEFISMAELRRRYG